MTHLRKMMLEELERRNYSEATKECTSMRLKSSPNISIAHQINCVRNTFGNSKPTFSPTES